MTRLLLSASLLLVPFSGTQMRAQMQHDHAAGEAMHHDKAPAVPSTQLTVTMDGKPTVFTLAELQAMPQVTVTVYNGHTKQNETYSGPPVEDVLAKCGLPLNEKTEHTILRKYVVATGTDGYFVVYSAAELESGLHSTQAIVALTSGGKPLGSSGQFQLINSTEKKPARWVRNLNGLDVRTVSK